MKAKKFARHRSDSSDVKLAAIGCPLCSTEMNAEITIKTVYGAVFGPYAGITVRLQCQNDTCKYYERTNVSAQDNETIKKIEIEVLKFERAIPTMGRWKKSSISNGKYQYRKPTRIKK